MGALPLLGLETAEDIEVPTEAVGSRAEFLDSFCVL